MVQIIPANPRMNKGESIGNALGNALSSGLGMYQQHQKQKRYGDALKGIEDIYADPNLSQEQKFIKSFSSLQEFPEAAKQFSSGLSQFSESPYQAAQRKKLEQETAEMKGEEDYLSRLMGGGRQNKEPEENIPNAPGIIKPEVLGKKTQQKTKQAEFDSEDPTTWPDKKIDQLRSMESKTTKGKTIAKLAQNEYERRKEVKASSKKYEENITPLQGALETLDRMEQIGKKGSLGIGTSVRGVFSPQTRKDSAEYERLGKSLISFASNIPIRNRAEFETLAHDLYDPSISDDSRAGILSAMKRIINNSMKAYQAPGQEESYQSEGTTPTRGTSQQQRPPLTSFLR